MITIHRGDNLTVTEHFPSMSFDLIYIDPPFNTGSTRRGNPGRAPGAEFEDDFEDYVSFLEPHLHEANRLLKQTGSFFLHLDYREIHYAKVACDAVFGRKSFMNEIIWAYDYGGRSRTKWPCKHDTILWYAKTPVVGSYTFNYDTIDRIPYMAPNLVSAEKAAKGKTVTDCWWHTIVPTMGHERTGYPTQKPVGMLRRLLTAHTRPGHRVLDSFAGSGTTGEAATDAGCDVWLIDSSAKAIQVMVSRFKRLSLAHNVTLSSGL